MAEKLKPAYTLEKDESDDDLRERNLILGNDASPEARTRERFARVVLERIKRMLQESREKNRMRKRLARLKRERAELKRETKEKKKLGGVVLNQVKTKEN